LSILDVAESGSCRDDPMIPDGWCIESTDGDGVPCTPYSNHLLKREHLGGYVEFALVMHKAIRYEALRADTVPWAI
jgi:hypothetical protein